MRRQLLVAGALVLALLVATIAHALAPAGRCTYVDEAQSNARGWLQSPRFLDHKLCVYICPTKNIAVWLARHQACPLSLPGMSIDHATR